MLLRIVFYAVLLYLALTVSLFFLQRRLLYLPTLARPSAQAAQALDLTFWHATDTDYQGFLSTGSTHPPNGTVMVFHGNAGTALDRSPYARALTPLGYRVLLMEYPGYGGRPGKPSEAALIDDARSAVQRAYDAFGPPLFLWGESLGSGVVAAVAAAPALPITAVILLTPWDSLPNLAQTLYPYFPARWLVRDTFDNVANLQSFRGRVAIILAAHDEVIPKRHGLRLYASITSPKRLWCFPQAGHNSWPIQPTASWWREVMAFVTAGSEQGDPERGSARPTDC